MGESADYLTFLNFVAEKFSDNKFSTQFYIATSIAQKSFDIELSEDDFLMMKQIFNIVDKDEQIERSNDEESQDLNRSMVSEASTTTFDRSYNSSPITQRFSPLKDSRRRESLSDAGEGREA
mmetsp:Transcript_10913/g.12373  ORF Transcript_10913/g.12373 Transcript_10913/m.12373 type:complete len:122 (+) Transcript_10913:519-884(+)|eukprot:CAMPEP_0205799228 /NCGR_PEP_ID=MMETSP0205-20121125/420_1 /ASSEMBLY_ACC=CAM_ASM_000278 /TAXON_ID=36767 /ORGANISM="Euplotes focardii, Strain TN1" /LENGTH=121 /DNA_ID=CAMNT_0053060173 /DNA_START=635 /DNA_END=1000 /DNA_ORIENTATION=+